MPTTPVAASGTTPAPGAGLDVARIRRQFPAIALADAGRPRVYLDNPGGTQVPQAVIDRTIDCLVRTNANLGGHFATSIAADRLVAEARQAWAGLTDYTCVLVRRERVGGGLRPEETMLMKAQREPYSVYLRWAAPQDMAGQEVCYVAGRHDGRMMVRPAGLFGSLGFLALDPNDPRARARSNHTITEAGLNPLPVRRSIPIWTGGSAEALLRRTARLADGWFPQGRPDDQMRETIERLRGYIREAGRDISAVGIEARVSVSTGNIDDLVRQTEQWRELGATHISINTMGAGFKSIDEHVSAIRRYKEALTTT